MDAKNDGRKPGKHIGTPLRGFREGNPIRGEVFVDDPLNCVP